MEKKVPSSRVTGFVLPIGRQETLFLLEGDLMLVTYVLTYMGPLTGGHHVACRFYKIPM